MSSRLDIKTILDNVLLDYRNLGESNNWKLNDITIIEDIDEFIARDSEGIALYYYLGEENSDEELDGLINPLMIMTVEFFVKIKLNGVSLEQVIEYSIIDLKRIIFEDFRKYRLASNIDCGNIRLKRIFPAIISKNEAIILLNAEVIY